MLRRIQHKLLGAVLLAVVMPFAAFGIFLERAIVNDLTWQFVRASLVGMARDLADQVDQQVARLLEDVTLWGAEPLAAWALYEQLSEAGELDWPLEGFGPRQILELGRGEELFLPGSELRRALVGSFDRYVATREHFELLLLIDSSGRLVLSNSRDGAGEPLDEALVRRLFDRDFRAEEWFAPALAGEAALQGHHVPELLYPDGIGDQKPSARLYAVGFAVPVPRHLAQGEVGGVLYALVSWQAFQALIGSPVVKDIFRGLSSEEDPSPYAWLWAADGETILAHEDPRLYLARVSQPPVALPQMVEDVRRLDERGHLVRGGLYREYEFRGRAKNAAFQRSAPPERQGFDWVVGVGIDNDDVEAATRGLSRLLKGGTAVVLLVVVLWVSVVARRTAGPILALREHTRRVAAGDLDARIAIDSRDELGALADDFNRMAAELSEKHRALVRAEKEAAWREMARQIAHDIKGPLTPMRLSLDLLERALREGGERSADVVERTLPMMRRQVEALREIATDFYHFTGGARSRPEAFDLGRLAAEVLELHRAWAERLGVEIAVVGEPGPVRVDPGKLRRVLTNLVANALEASPEGGRLEARTAIVPGEDGRTWVEWTLTDEGVGLSEEVRAHLFEPYFTTRSEGTGLGLAIALRTLEEMGGSIELGARPDGAQGTRARVRLPRVEPG